MEIIYTVHSEQRIIRRKITKQEVEEAIKFPDKVNKKHDKYYFQKKLERGSIEVCAEKTWKNIKVITVYWI